MKFKIIVFFSISLLLFSGGYLTGNRWKFKTSQVKDIVHTFTAERGDFVVSIVETGALKAKKSTRIFSGLERKVKIIYLAPEGTRVKKGDVLIKFDPAEVIRELKSIRQKIRAAKAKLEAAEVDMDIQKIDGSNKTAKAGLTFEEAKKNLEKYQEGEAPLQEREKKIKLEEAKAKLSRSRDKLKQMPKLLEEGFVTNDRVEQEKINVKKAEVEYDMAKSELTLFIKYTFPLEIEKKKSEVVKAKSDLNATKKQVSAKIKQKQTELDSLQLELENHNAELNKLLEEEKKMINKAPTNGLVIYGDPDNQWSTNSIQVGKEVWGHDTLITLPDLSEMQVLMKVHETDIRRVKNEMPVIVTIEAAGNLSTSGKITKVAELANSGDWRSDPEVKQFDVEITLDKGGLRLKPGTTAKVEIPIAQLKNVIKVPVDSVRSIGTEIFCYVAEKEHWQRRKIKIGLSNDKFVEIISGLKENEKILTGQLPKKLLKEENQQRENKT